MRSGVRRGDAELIRAKRDLPGLLEIRLIGTDEISSLYCCSRYAIPEREARPKARNSIMVTSISALAVEI